MFNRVKTSRKPVGSGSSDRPSHEYSTQTSQLTASPYVNARGSPKLASPLDRDSAGSEEFFDSPSAPTDSGKDPLYRTNQAVPESLDTDDVVVPRQRNRSNSISSTTTTTTTMSTAPQPHYAPQAVASGGSTSTSAHSPVGASSLMPGHTFRRDEGSRDASGSLRGKPMLSAANLGPEGQVRSTSQSSSETVTSKPGKLQPGTAKTGPILKSGTAKTGPVLQPGTAKTGPILKPKPMESPRTSSMSSRTAVAPAAMTSSLAMPATPTSSAPSHSTEPTGSPSTVAPAPKPPVLKPAPKSDTESAAPEPPRFAPEPPKSVPKPPRSAPEPPKAAAPVPPKPAVSPSKPAVPASPKVAAPPKVVAPTPPLKAQMSDSSSSSATEVIAPGAAEAEEDPFRSANASQASFTSAADYTNNSSNYSQGNQSFAPTSSEYLGGFPNQYQNSSEYQNPSEYQNSNEYQNYPYGYDQNGDYAQYQGFYQYGNHSFASQQYDPSYQQYDQRYNQQYAGPYNASQYEQGFYDQNNGSNREYGYTPYQSANFYDPYSASQHSLPYSVPESANSAGALQAQPAEDTGQMYPYEGESVSPLHVSHPPGPAPEPPLPQPPAPEPTKSLNSRQASVSSQSRRAAVKPASTSTTDPNRNWRMPEPAVPGDPGQLYRNTEPSVGPSKRQVPLTLSSLPNNNHSASQLSPLSTPHSTNTDSSASVQHRVADKMTPGSSPAVEAVPELKTPPQNRARSGSHAPSVKTMASDSGRGDKSQDAQLGFGKGSVYVNKLRADAGETQTSRQPASLPLGLRRTKQRSPINVKPDFLRRAMDMRYQHLPQRMLETEVDDDDDDDVPTGITKHNNNEPPMIYTASPQHSIPSRSSSPVDSIVEQAGKIKLFVANPDDDDD